MVTCERQRTHKAARKRTLLAGLALVVCGCAPAPSSTTSPSPPAPAPNPSPPRFTVSGVVYQSAQGGATPLAEVGLDVSVDYQSWPPNVTTDAVGRYQFAIGGGPRLKVRAEKEGHSQPCAATFTPSGNTTLDVYVVPNSVLSTTGIPASMPIRQPSVAGTVFERMADGSTRGLSGATLIADFSSGLGWSPSATTVSDAAGRYFLCGLTSTLGIELDVEKTGYRGAFVALTSGVGEKDLDIELTRQ